MSPPTQLSRSSESPGKRQSCLSIFFVALFLVAALVFLSMLTMGFAAFALLIVAGIFGIAAFHYFVWGWWLSRIIEEETERALSDDSKSKLSDDEVHP